MKTILKDYHKTRITLQNIELESLTISDDSRFNLIYGLNVETKEEGLYLYDSKDNTIVKYNDEHIVILEEKIKTLTYSTIAFIASTVLALFGIIALSKKKKRSSKNKKNVNQMKQNKENNETADPNQIIDKSNEVYNIYEDDKKKKKRQRKK